MNYASILNFITSSVWAMHPQKLDAIIALVVNHERGITIDADRWAQLESSRSQRVGIQQGVATLGLHGTISQRAGLLTGSGGTSTDQFAASFLQAVRDPAVGAIVVDVDSPGGSVFKLNETSKLIFEHRGQKPMVAVANSEAYSAAYHLASAFDKFYVTPSGMVGSIGTVATHVDQTEYDKAMGVKYEFVHSGEHKVSGNPHEPLNDTARADLQRIVDQYGEEFTATVARNRGVSAKVVRDTYGQGKVFTSGEAKERGMVDGIKSLEEVQADMMKRVSGRRKYLEARTALDNK